MERAYSWTKRLATVAVLFVAGGAMAAPGLFALDMLRPGLWSLRERGSPSERQVCIARGADFGWVAHRSGGCRVVHSKAGPDRISVNYICPGQVQGMTRIRQESDRLLQIETQGFAGGAPFHKELEARWLGSCR